MVDQVRSESYLRHPTTGAMKDNTTGLITPQVARDEHVSVRDFAKSKIRKFGTSSTTLNIDCTYDTQEIQLNHSISTLTFSNRRPVNLVWPNNDLQHSNWIIGANTTVTAGFTDPIGTSTAYRIQMAASGNVPGTVFEQAFEAVAGANYTGLIWAKENGVTSLPDWGFDNTLDTTLSLAANQFTPTGSWARYSVAWVGTAGTRYLELDNRGGTTAVDILIWRPQLYASDILPDDLLLEDTFYDTTASPVGEATQLTLILKQDGVGTRTITWPSNVLFPSGTDPTLSTIAGAYDIVSLVSYDGGALWFGVLGGKAFA